MTAIPRQLPPVTSKAVPAWLAQALVVLGGMCAAAQAAVNGELGQRVESPLVAAAMSNTFGGLVFVIALLSASRVRAGVRRLWRHRLPWWMYTGGAFGAVYVFTGSLTVPMVGVAVFTVAQVCGNSLGALGSDAVGLGPAGKLAVTAPRLAGALLAVVAVALAQWGHGFSTADWWLVPFILVVGGGLALQAAFNGQVNEVSGAPLASGLVNFSIGTLLLYAVVGIVALTVGVPVVGWPSQPWLYLGGPLGSVLLVCSITATRVIGVLRVALGVLSGQLVGAVLLDVFAHTVPDGFVLGGVVLTAVAVALASWASRLPVSPEPVTTSHAETRAVSPSSCREESEPN